MLKKPFSSHNEKSLIPTSSFTQIEGVLRIGSAFPDPPFEVEGSIPSGFDVELIQLIAKELGLNCEFYRYEKADFNGIFDGLETGEYDAVISGATITDQRLKFARFCSPYLRSGQSLVVNIDHLPAVQSMDDLMGGVIGVQLGNTSEPVARQLHQAGKVSDVKVYAYDQILQALDDLEREKISAFMKLEPVMRWLTRNRPRLKVVQTKITHELLAIAVRRSNEQLATAIEKAQKAIGARGELQGLEKKWMASSDPKATEVLI